jgi:hypothetical protein
MLNHDVSLKVASGFAGGGRGILDHKQKRQGSEDERESCRYSQGERARLEAFSLL